MISFAEKIAELEAEGYANAPIQSRLRRTFGSSTFMQRLSGTRANWMDEPPRKVVAKILAFLDTLET